MRALPRGQKEHDDVNKGHVWRSMAAGKGRADGIPERGKGVCRAWELAQVNTKPLWHIWVGWQALNLGRNEIIPFISTGPTGCECKL